MRASDLLHAHVLRYTVIAVLAFSIGSASIVFAASSGAVQLPTFRLADGTNPDQLAKVDANGSVQVSVANQPTSQQISGAVSVTNFPSTQNVNVTGGTLRTTPSLVTRSVSRSRVLDAGENDSYSFTSINASFINVSSSNGDVLVQIWGSVGQVFSATLGDDEVHTISLTQQIPLDSLRLFCFNSILSCSVSVVIFGN